MAEPGPTRRSSRSLSAPDVALNEQPQRSRAELRGRTTDAATARPAVVWGRDENSDVAPAESVEPTGSPQVSSTPAPLSRRARRIIATPTVAISVIESESVLPDVAPLADVAEPTPTDAFELLEPIAALADEQLDDRETAAPEPERPIQDEFEAAARLFSFTGETPIIAPDPSAAAPEERSHVVRRRRGTSFKRVAAASFSIGVMSIVGLLAVGMTTPTQAVAAATGTANVETVQQLAGDVEASHGQIQAYVAPSQIQNTQIDRAENYQTARLVDLAGSEGISNFSTSVFSNNPNCAIQWPFAVGVTMSYGFGMRDGTMHEGVDFTPGDGAHIQAIDDGVVRISTDSGGAFGVTIVIDHVVDGQLVSSRYGHMQYGSRQVEVGDHVSVGEYIGRTGDTGRSFGAHTHVEILAGGTTPIDPMPWFEEHATC